MYTGTIVQTAGLSKDDIYIHIRKLNTLTGFVSSVRRLAGMTDFSVYQASDGNYYVESGDQRRKQELGIRCDPFVSSLEVGYMGTQAGAESEDVKFRTSCQTNGIPEVKQVRFENQEIK